MWNTAMLQRMVETVEAEMSDGRGDDTRCQQVVIVIAQLQLLQLWRQRTRCQRMTVVVS